jgi:hypothetical protein
MGGRKGTWGGRRGTRERTGGADWGSGLGERTGGADWGNAGAD